MRQVRRYMTANVKGGTSPRGLGAGGPALGLGPADRRIREAVRRAREAGVTVLGMQELSRIQAQVLADLEGWTLVTATPNTVLPGGVELGNGLLFDRDVYALRRVDVLEVTVSGQVLHFPVVEVNDREIKRVLPGLAVGPEQRRFIVVHFPAGKSPRTWWAKRTCARAVRRYLERCGPSIETVVLGDLNSRLFRRWEAVRSGPDAICSPTIGFRGRRVHRDFDGEISDHAALSAQERRH